MSKQNKVTRVAFFVYYGWLSISPSLESAIKILSEVGYVVDVIYLYDDIFGYYEPGLDNVCSIPIKSNKIKYINRPNFFIACYNITKSYEYDFYIGVDQEGIIIAGILAKLRNIPFCYYSLEILAKEDIFKRKGSDKILWSIIKILESYFSRKAFVTIVQDNYRSNILIKDNLLDKNTIFIVPNSYYFDENNYNHNNYDLRIPNDKNIVLYAGSIVPEILIKEIVCNMNLWPDDAVLVLHTVNRTAYLEEIEHIISQNNLQNKVVISLKRLTFDELCNLIRKSHIGISFYDAIDKNTELACSGKVSFYLSQGLPIIINSTSPQSKELVSKYRCGVCVDSPDDVGKAIRIILENYSGFAENAKRAYQQELDFLNYFNKVLAYIKSFLLSRVTNRLGKPS